MQNARSQHSSYGQAGRDDPAHLVHLLFVADLGDMALVRPRAERRPAQATRALQVSLPIAQLVLMTVPWSFWASGTTASAWSRLLDLSRTAG